MFFKKVAHADFTDRFFKKGESKVQIDPQFVQTFTLLDGKFSDRILEIINSNRKSILSRFSFLSLDWASVRIGCPLYF